MKKTKRATKTKTISLDRLINDVRSLLEKAEELKDKQESEWCELCSEVLGTVLEGIEMRRQELQEESN